IPSSGNSRATTVTATRPSPTRSRWRPSTRSKPRRRRRARRGRSARRSHKHATRALPWRTNRTERATWRTMRSSSATMARAARRASPSAIHVRTKRPNGAERPMSWAQIAIDGLALGAAYALVALGFVLILNAAGAVNFAQGDFVMAGGFAAIVLAGLLPLEDIAIPGLILAPLVALTGGGAGWLVAEIAYRP